MEEFKFKIINVCSECFRELKFDIKVDNSTMNHEYEIQSPICEDCFKEAIEKERKKIMDKVTNKLKKIIID